MSVESVSERLAWPDGRLLRIEHGEIAISPADLITLLGVYGISDPDRVDRFCALARSAKEQTWWHDRKHLPPEYIELISAEADASHITHFHPIFVPGLLQTRSYATAITSATTLKEAPPEATTARVEARMRRQRELFDRPAPVALTALVDEMALHRRIGSAATMREQLDHLAVQVERSGIEVVIVPRSAEAHPGLLGAFMLIEYGADPYLEDVICFEGATGNQLVRARPDLVTAYRRLADRLIAVGYTGESARQSIRVARREYP